MVVDHGSVNGSPRPARLHRCQLGCGARVRPMALPLPVLPRAIPAVSCDRSRRRHRMAYIQLDIFETANGRQDKSELSKRP